MDLKNTNRYQFVLDVHMHTLASGHAYGTIREMAQAASEKGLALIGITEHGPGIPGTCDGIYFRNLGSVPRQLYGVEICHGCEANVLNNGTHDVARGDAACLDYVIVGIHRLCYEDAGREQNTDNVISCMKDDRVFFVSHPDDDKTPLNYERLVKAAGEYHVALELNNSSLMRPETRLNCVANYRRMLALCQQYRVPIVVDSDAHDPSFVGRTDEAQRLLEELDFDSDLIINTSVEKFKEFIGF